MPIKSYNDAEGKIPNISKNYPFWTFEEEVIQRKSWDPYQFQLSKFDCNLHLFSF